MNNKRQSVTKKSYFHKTCLSKYGFSNHNNIHYSNCYKQKINLLDIQLKQREKKLAMIRRKRFTFCNKVDKKTQSRMKMQIQQNFFYNEFYKKGNMRSMKIIPKQEHI